MKTRSFHSFSFQLTLYMPPKNQLRRNSCHCSHCSTSNKKQFTLPNQQFEINMHRKTRLANLIISNFQPSNRYLRSKQKHKNFQIFNRNKQQLLLPNNNHQSSDKTSSCNSQDEIINDSQSKITSTKYSKHQNSKQSNTYYINHLKTQMTRIDKNLNLLIQTSRQQITEPDNPINTSKKNKQVIIKTIQTHRSYQSAQSITLNKNLIPQVKMYTTPNKYLNRTQQTLSKYALNSIS